MSFVFQKGDRIGVQLMNDNKLMDVELFQSLYDTVVIGKTIDQVADRLQTAPHNIAANRPDPVIQAKLAKSIRDAGYPQPESLECGSDNCHMRGKSEDVNSPFVSHKCRGCGTVENANPVQLSAGRDVAFKNEWTEAMKTSSEKSEVMSVQHGGNHYKGMKIEPVDYAMENNLDCLQFSVVKYVTRHKLKGKAEDLKKCIHFAQMALEKCYGVKSSVEFEEPKKAGE